MMNGEVIEQMCEFIDKKDCQAVITFQIPAKEWEKIKFSKEWKIIESMLDEIRKGKELSISNYVPDITQKNEKLRKITINEGVFLDGFKLTGVKGYNLNQEENEDIASLTLHMDVKIL